MYIVWLKYGSFHTSEDGLSLTPFPGNFSEQVSSSHMALHIIRCCRLSVLPMAGHGITNTKRMSHNMHEYTGSNHTILFSPLSLRRVSSVLMGVNSTTC